MSEKKISTIEDLAIMVQGEFAKIHDEFFCLGKGFSSVQGRFDSLAKELKEIKIILRQIISSLAISGARI